ncbi:nucleotidyltransferase family protein [Niallia sp. NCCP-28]|uniref:nucleotidyltransferase family protein n=1 Tax=Niallia sp. NCCP-28 TaxID=2934712 RepID=UPI00207E115E|nr:nucleotidyltransferase family protein [Niallia sp. NCCP-28]GKU80713.1 hypothetical protein NCCP28_01090 [Niallia sp. NCCP-28]
MNTTKKVSNEDEIKSILKKMVDTAYEQIKGEEILLCMECCDVDLFVAAESYPELEEAIKKNYELDEYGEVIDHDGYIQLMRELDDYFVELHIQSGYYDYFPAGIYELDGKEEETETDILAPKGVFYAPFEEAVKTADKC